jgi:flagellin
MPVINTNTAANTALRYLNQNAETQSNSLAKLASGSRIAQASDDAAGLAIGTQLQSDVTALAQAGTNASQANSMLQAADGGLARISDILQRMKALATESASGNVTNSQRSNDINVEYGRLYSEIDVIATGTRYAGASLLNSSGIFSASAGLTFVVGTTSSDTITVTGSSFQVAASSLLTAGGAVASSVSTQTTASSAIDTLTTAINTITQNRATIGAYESQFQFQGDSIATTMENNSAAASTIMDADVASEKARLSSADVKTQAAVAAMSQANQMPQALLKLLG